jgi:hypothetical protein
MVLSSGCLPLVISAGMPSPIFTVPVIVRAAPVPVTAVIVNSNGVAGAPPTPAISPAHVPLGSTAYADTAMRASAASTSKILTFMLYLLLISYYHHSLPSRRHGATQNPARLQDSRGTSRVLGFFASTPESADVVATFYATVETGAQMNFYLSIGGHRRCEGIGGRVGA